MIHHYCVAFIPNSKLPFWEGGMQFTPLYPPLNGLSGLTFFFVLSGYVLTLKFFAVPSWRGVTGAVLKRLPRLVVPVFPAIILGYLLLTVTNFPNVPASAISDSPWLFTYAQAGFPEPFEPSLLDALRQSVMTFLQADDYYYNSNLWTMRIEYIGSLIVFAILYGFLLARAHLPLWVQGAVIVAVSLVLLAVSPAFAGFPLGAGLAWLQAVVNVNWKLPKWTIIMLLGCVYCMTMFESWRLLTINACVVMVLLLQPGANSGPLSGPAGRWLGQLSFPLYLVHALVILSVSSWVFYSLTDAGIARFWVLTVTLIVTAALSFAGAAPFMALERWWVPRLNRMFRAMGF